MKSVNTINLRDGVNLPRRESHTVLDIDGVLANFAKGFLNQAKRIGLGHKYPLTVTEAEAKGWDYGLSRREFEEVWVTCKTDPQFWLDLEVYPKTLEQLTFNPIAYITHRPISNAVTQRWLEMHGFPVIERCYTVENVEDKVAIAKKLGAKRIIDDRIETCQLFIDEGLDAYLFSRPGNLTIEKLDRISALSELNAEGLKAAA